MKHHYPSVTELLAFTLSAKHLSFSRAARELGQTPSAISRQVANLESFFNVQLFVRDAKQVALTHSGALYLARIAKPLADIGHASIELLAARGEGALLTLASVPTFTSVWLTPRLPRFLAQSPGITLSFARHLAQGDAFDESLDAAIRYGDGRWEGVVSEYIDGRDFVLVCAPDLIARHPRLKSGDVANLPRLIHSQAEDVWSQWAMHHDVDGLHGLIGPRFEQYSVLIQAAQAGLGFALIPKFLVRDKLAAGALLTPLPDTGIEVDQGHYLCYPPQRLAQRPGLQRFRDWLLREAATSGGDPA